MKCPLSRWIALYQTCCGTTFQYKAALFHFTWWRSEGGCVVLCFDTLVRIGIKVFAHHHTNFIRTYFEVKTRPLMVSY